MEARRKRSCWEGPESLEQRPALQVKKQRSVPETMVIDLTSPPPEEVVRKQPMAPRRIDSAMFIHDPTQYPGQQYQTLDIIPTPEGVHIDTRGPSGSAYTFASYPPMEGCYQPAQIYGNPTLMHYQVTPAGYQPLQTHHQPAQSNKKQKFYAVAVGRKPGIYADWSAAEAQIEGYRGALHHCFKSIDEAWSFMDAAGAAPPSAHPQIPVQTPLYQQFPQYQHPLDQQSYLQGTHAQKALASQTLGLPITKALEPSSNLHAQGRSQPLNNTMLPAKEKIGPDHAAMPTASQIRPHSSAIPPSSATFAEHMMQPSSQGMTDTPKKKARKAKAEPDLCDEQQKLVDLIMSGRNVFYTGSAGCGKSTVLKAFVKQFKEADVNFVIVAPTGKAALEVNGSTYFTFAGWTPDHFKKPLQKLCEDAKFQKFVQKRLSSVQVLIIDEISMIENHAFERLNAVMKAARNNDQAFGGVQLVVTGDFCQLPPVKPFKFCMQCGRETKEAKIAGETVYKCSKHGDFQEKDKWAFRSKAWREAAFTHVNLKQIHRQKDRKFINILERCRMGMQLTHKERDLLLNHKSNVDSAVRLFSTREEVRKLNMEEYNKLQAVPRLFSCLDNIRIQPEHPNLKWKAQRMPDGTLSALKEQKFDPRVELKEGMRVVLQVNLNISAGLVNGSQGVVVGWEPFDEKALPKVDKTRGETGNKSGPAPLNPLSGGDHAVYREFHIKEFSNVNQVKEWPIVEFENGVKRTIFAECIVSELGDTQPYTLMSRTQIPLLAGWAMTVHKSQGMTLTKVEVDLGRAFEEGQMYVALSRARSLHGLKVRSLGKWTGGGNEQVMEFLKEKFGITVDT